MSSLFSNKLKKGLEYMNEGFKIMKDESMHQLSKKVSWIKSPYSMQNQEEKTILSKNIDFSNMRENGDKSMFDDRRII